MSSFLPEIKKRSFSSGRTITVTGRSSGSGTWFTNTTPVVFGTEEIISQCHTGYWKGSDTVGDVGGEMRLTRHKTTFDMTKPNWGTPGAGLIYGEPYFGTYNGSSAFGPGSQGHDDATLALFGTKAISATAPTNPSFSLATALGELKKDGLPNFPELLRDRANFARKAGSDYLNIEFGWLPLLRDVRDFAITVKNSRRILDQYIRDSGRHVRRRFGGPPIIDTSVQTAGGHVQPTAANWVANGTLSETRETFYWFSGAFVYHIPSSDTFIGEFRRMESLANHLLGTRITPDVLWELAPWSWATDWFFNVGDMLNNISVLGTDGLVLHHGYAMRNQRVKSVYRQTTVPLSGIGRSPAITVGKTVLSEYKRRIRANPYGFGVDFDGLTERQLAILAALALAKGQRDGDIRRESF